MITSPSLSLTPDVAKPSWLPITTSLIVLLFTRQTFAQLQPPPFCLIPSCFYFLALGRIASFFRNILLLLLLPAAARSTFACRCFSPSRL
ncbi:uncharacterized protein LY79DRAFT_543802 [Colletotrichum navitas]|uniref:Uncharacterized protein n=1 Tax=Colletotrichum navitas TaxID=681940 RepID=A0AAD8Q665_9PEZI|nr:uncharacterized protein LY79DRAFT_543802 [Colletotrichum navitas]KAK1596648.1 hypothetical protein LY79DRAFT_543802 [Colletotrichum navitas]